MTYESQMNIIFVFYKPMWEKNCRAPGVCTNNHYKNFVNSNKDDIKFKT